jgi:hypothetical protein
MTLEDRVRRHRLAILQRAALLGNVTQACRETGISRTLFYRWRRRYVRYGADGLRPRPTRPSRWPRQAIPVLEYQVLAYALPWPTHGPARIAIQLRQPLWGGWRISASGVYGILTRHGLQTRWERLTRLEPGGDGRAADGADRPTAAAAARGGPAPRRSGLPPQHRAAGAGSASLPALLQPGSIASRLPAARPDARVGFPGPQGQLSTLEDNGWRTQVSAPRPYRTN